MRDPKWPWEKLKVDHFGDYCYQNFLLGRYIVRYTVGNLVLQQCESRTVKHYFRSYIRQYTSPMKSLDMVIPILMHLWCFVSNWSVASGIKPHVIQRNCGNFLTLSNQMLHSKIKYIRIDDNEDFNWASMRENLTLMHANNKGANQPAHPCSLVNRLCYSPLGKL